jgi:hypothetical protein
MKTEVCGVEAYRLEHPTTRRGKPTKGCEKCASPLFIMWRGAHVTLREVVDKILAEPAWRGAEVSRSSDLVTVRKGSAVMHLKLSDVVLEEFHHSDFCLRRRAGKRLHLCYKPRGHEGDCG